MKIGLPGAVFIVFLIMKLLGFINWSWWLVTAPLWGSFALGVLVFIGIGITTLLKVRKIDKQIQDRGNIPGRF